MLAALRQRLRRRRPGGAARRPRLRRDAADRRDADPLARGRRTSAPKARSVIFLYMDGGPSQVDTFDPKPRLDREHGQPFKMKIEPTQFNNVGNTLGSPVEVPASTAQSGMPVSDLFPHVATCVDDLAIIRSMIVELLRAHQRQLLPAHRHGHAGPAEHGRVGRPTAWAASASNLPGFVVLNGGLIPPGGLDNFNSGFLPAAYQGSIFQRRRPRRSPTSRPLEAEPRAAARQARPARASSTAASLERLGHARRARVGDRQLRAGVPDAGGRARADGPRGRDRRRRRQLYGLDDHVRRDAHLRPRSA